MCPIRRNSFLVHVPYPQILGTNGLVVVVVQNSLLDIQKFKTGHYGGRPAMAIFQNSYCQWSTARLTESETESSVNELSYDGRPLSRST